MAGADVYAVCSNFETRGQKVLVAKTDAMGAYRIPDLPVGSGQTGPYVYLVAHQPGFGLAVADGQSEKGQASGNWMDVQKDLVLPDTHARLMVRVLQDGKPTPNIRVILAAQGENWVVPAIYRESDRGEAAQALRALLTPSAQTGPDGAARFADLTPGLWDVTANRTASPVPLIGEPAPPPPFNVSTGVIMQAGEDASYTVSLIPPPSNVVFHFVGPNGLPLPAVPEVVSLTTALDSNYGSIALTPDGAGNGLGKFYAPGLFQITARVGDRPLDINALIGPYFEGTALVAVSPATAARSPISIPTHRIGPASIRIRLQDAQGKPLHGAVTIGDTFARYAASADANGVVVFPNVPLNFFKYTVTAHITGRPERVPLGQPGSPLPSDAALVAGTGQPLPQPVVVRGGEVTSVTLGAQLPGYVRLRLTGPLASEKGYYVEGRLPTDDAFVPTQFDPATDEYLIGPLPAGRRTFHLFRYVGEPVGTNLNAGEIGLTVKAGQVVHATLTAQSTAAQELLSSSPLTGTVYLPDGQTPAWGARAALFLPDWSVPLRMARADTQGRLTVKDFWRSSPRSLETPPGAPTGPVLAAWLPGANGAVIVPFQPGRDERLVLPAPVSLHGRVTVGSQSVRGLPSSFRARAAYQGKGRLNEALSVEATAQADGTFELAGLTPGTYRVQAARDGIWLSGTQTVMVGTETLPDLTLDIAPPGVPVILKLEDQQGKPRPGQEVRIARPDGPLTEEIWPTMLTADSAGNLRVDGLEAGHHLVTIAGQAGKSVGFDVPAWTPAAPPAIRRIVLPLAP